MNPNRKFDFVIRIVIKHGACQAEIAILLGKFFALEDHPLNIIEFLSVW